MLVHAYREEIQVTNRDARLARHGIRLAVAAAIGASLAAASMPAAAAEPGDDEVLAEVQVTGSRIVRRDYEANSPIVTVDAETFEKQSGQNVESYLNQLPNFNPAASPTTTEDDIQPTAVNSVGIATISLRGFGPNRSLVLLDGKRPVPANALMVTDVNSIPSAMLERVEIISGGASAVYGADAIGGVTNFILKKKFKGVEFDAQYGITEAGDGEEFRASGVLGTDFADGRGNITVAIEHYDRKAALERNRRFYRKSWNDPNQLSDDLFLYGSSGYNSGNTPYDRVTPGASSGPFNVPNENTVKALFPNSPANTNQHTRNANTHQYRFGPNGQIWTGLFGNNLSKYEAVYGANAYSDEFAKVNTFDTTIPTLGVPIQTLKYNDIEALASAPQKRYSFFTAADYDITDKINVFARVNFSQSKTFTLLYPTVPISGWDARTTFNPTTDSPLNPALNWTDAALVRAALANPSAYANPNFRASGTAGAQHPVPNEVAILLMSRPDPDGEWMTEMFASKALGRRTTDNTNTYWQVESGLDFQLPFRDWTGELYWSHGETSSYNLSKGNLSLQRWRALVNQPDWGRNATLRANADYPGDPSRDASNVNFGTVPAHCTSGLYDSFFKGDVAPSADCLAMVSAELQGRSSNKQDVVELNLQGGLFKLPAGELRAAVGGSWRDNGTRYTPDILESNISFLDQVVGIYPSSYLDASQDVKDVYGELLVPVLKDLPLLQKVELELGYRASEYQHTDSTQTYKALANIQVSDALRLRGGFNRANRAPNLGELYLGLQQIFTGSAGIFGDACGLRSNASYGAGGAAPDPVLDTGEPQTQLAAGQTAAGALSTYLICQAQMGAGGAANFYSGNAGGNVADFANAWRMQIGNPNLKSEKADTWSAGFVFAGAGVSDNAWMRGFTGSVDWWKVTIEDAIQQYSPDYAGYLCYGVKTVTTLAEAVTFINGEGKDACDKVPREPTRGTALSKQTAYDNQATIETSGIDVALNWFAQLQDIGIGVPGGIGLNTQATFLDYFRTKASPLFIDVPVEWKGSLGPDLIGTNPGAYDYRLMTNLSYRLENFNISLGWRYLPSVDLAATAYQNAVIANNRRVSAGAPGSLLSFIPTEAIKTKDYSQFNLSMTYQLNDTLTVRAGVDNLFDATPSLTGSTTGVTLAEYTHRCDGAAPGCQNPTGPSLARTGTGTGAKGFNDILGRRFFLGLKARF
jgi:outer membrane receptor protein involved in Fe transport